LTDRLYLTRAELAKVTEENIDVMLSDERGTNEMSMGKATGFFSLFEVINEILFDEMNKWMGELLLLTAETKVYIDELRRFSLLRKGGLMNYEAEHVESFSYNIVLLEDSHFTLSPSEIKLDKPKKFKIAHTPEQKIKIQTYSKEFGNHHDGMGKMLMRYPHIHRIFRRSQVVLD
jgi:hypothetical protein